MKHERLIELQKQNNLYAKNLLLLEWVIGIISSLTFLILIFVASYIEMDMIVRLILILTSIIIFIVGMIFALRIERIVGYYKCGKCGYKYVPTNKQMLLSMHIGRTRYMKCPKCNNRSWNKKDICIDTKE